MFLFSHLFPIICHKLPRISESAAVVSRAAERPADDARPAGPGRPAGPREPARPAAGHRFHGGEGAPGRPEVLAAVGDTRPQQRQQRHIQPDPDAAAAVSGRESRDLFLLPLHGLGVTVKLRC